MSSNVGAPAQYRAVLFKRTIATSDFSCSQQLDLPGRHTAAGAWQAIFAALQGAGGDAYVGGEVRPG